MSANIHQEHRVGSSFEGSWRRQWTSRLPLMFCALAYFASGVFGTTQDPAVYHEFAPYWLANALFLAVLWTNSRGMRLQLLVVSIAHVVPVLSASVPVGRVVSSLFCNEGLVLAVVAMLRPVLEQRASYPRSLFLDVTVTQAIGGALSLVVVIGVLVSLGDAAEIFPTAGSLIEQCVAACALETIVGFAMVTPAVVCWSRIRRFPVASQWLPEAMLAASIAALVCVAAGMHGGIIGMTLLCLLPVITLWAGLCLSAEALTGALLVSMLVLQFLMRPIPGGNDDGVVQLFLFATAVGSLAVLELRVRHKARLDVVSKRLRQAMKRARSTQARLRSRNLRQELILKAVDGAVFCWDLRRDSLWWNARAERYFGERSQIRAGWLVWGECIDPVSRAPLLQELRRFLDGKEKLWRSDLTIRTPSAADAMPVRCRAFLIRDELGKPSRMIGALSDLTDAQAADQSSRAFNRATRLAAIGEITAAITHEVNQPLAAILNNAETALYLIKEGRSSPEILTEILDDIRRDDLRASEVARRTRTLLQDRELLRRSVDLNHIVADAVRLMSQTARRRHIDVIVTSARVCVVHADSLHLQQVMLNLLGNAFDAVEKANRGYKRVEVSTCLEAGYAQVRVTDFGCGIPEAEVDRVFEAFRTNKTEGLGLGLSLARFIVSAHGGRIFAANNSCGRGATIRFELPVSVERPAERLVTSLS